MSQTTLPDGLISFGSDANCTLELCPLESSILRYQPNVPANAIFLGVFATSMAIHIFQGIKMKTWGFMSSMMAGCILEIVGYVGRLMIHDDPFDFIGFLLQIIFITIAPVFFSAAIYVLLSQVINFVDPSVSRFPARYFYWIFIPSDIISLILQAVGGAMSCIATKKEDIKTGEDISIAGLVFQVFTLICFVALFIDYVIRAYKSPSRYRLNKPIVVFLFFLFLATIFILIRCGYRIAELEGGYFSALFRDEGLYIALESCMMCIAVLLLNAGHPGYAFKETPEFPKEKYQMEQDDTTVFGD
ncbi:phospholipid-translocating ATPase [Fusarium beomiforme]|uniref:Phospholipid-translocating ATPase n=1 Tax=Fusarium beomiforme TaxID=44412 RepID=A0A9P5DS05_9HYPO|nr:phospholipid-translocating ATPase [Fusarium beomiforme]